MCPRTTAEIEAELDAFRADFRNLNASIQQQTAEIAWSTPSEIVFEYGSMRVRHFITEQATRHAEHSISVPTLIVYSQVNAPFIIDLHSQYSLVRRLIESGQNVFLLEWGELFAEDCHHPLSTYIREYIDAAVNHLCKTSDINKVNLIGICQGGTFSLCYAALYPEKVSALVTMVTPVDFHAGDGLLTHLIKYIDFELLEKSPINIPGAVLTRFFQALRPFNDLRRQVEVIRQRRDSRDVALLTLMDQWVFGGPDQPGKALAQFARWFFQENRLVNHSLTLDDDTVSLDKITAPILNVFSQNDHIVPAASATALKQLVDPALYTEQIFPGGHIGLLVSEKAQQTMLPQIGAWLVAQNQGKSPVN